jgi:Chondroitinase B
MMSSTSYLPRTSQSMSILALSAVIITGLIADPASATTYYVATTGSNSNPGSQGSPWLTMQKAADTMVAGDTTIVRNGTYTQGQLVFRTSGASGARITLRAENQYQAILSSTSSCSPSISLYASYITIDGLRLTVSPSDVNCTSGTTANSYIHMWNSNEPVRGGNESSGYVGGWAKNLQMDNPNGHRYGAFKTRQDDSIIERNTVYGEIEAFKNNNAIIRNNLVYSGLRTSQSIATKGGSRNTQIYNNTVRILGGGWIQGIVVGGCTGSPWFFDTATQIETYNSVAYNNVVINDNGNTTNRALTVRSASNSAAFNNVLINAVPVEYTLSCNSDGIPPPPSINPVVVNNIFVDQTGGNSYAMGGLTQFTGTSTLDYNNFFGFSSPPSQEHPITGDPLFVNPASDWHLRAGSPAIGTGTPRTMTGYGGESIVVNQAKDGVTRPANAVWDLGIYQTGGGAGDITPPASPLNLRVQ